METTKKKGLSWKIYVAYICGGIMLNLTQVADQYGLFFLTDIAKFDSAIAGTILTVTATIAAFIDPAVGNLADQTNTRWGKYRPYVIFVPFVVAGALMGRFAAPNLSTAGATVYYSVCIGVFVIAMSFLAVPVSTFRTVLSDDYDERNKLLSASSIASAICGNAIGLTCVGAVAFFGGGQRGWFLYATCAAILIIVCGTICQRGVRFVDAPGKIATPPKKPLVTALFRMFTNKPVMCIACAMFLSTFVTMIANNVAMHYYTHVLHDTSVLAKVSGFGLPIQIISLLSIPFILKKIDKRTLLFIGFSLNMIKPVAIMIWGASLSSNVVIVLIIIQRIGGSFFTPAITSWIPECVDWTNLKEGAGAAALIGATVSFFQKMGRSVASGAAGGLLAFAGYNPKVTTEVTETAVKAILDMNGIYCAAGLCLAMIPIILFPISRTKAQEIRAQLDARNAEKKAD